MRKVVLEPWQHETSRWVQTRIAALVAVRALRTGWLTAALLIATGALALGVVLPVTSLHEVTADGLRPQLRLAPTPDQIGLPWSAVSQSVAATRQDGVDILGTMLLSLAVMTLVLAAVTILNLALAREGQRAGEIVVQRAAGATRRLVLGAGSMEAALLGLPLSIIGALGALVLWRSMAGEWTGSPPRTALLTSVVASAALTLVLVAGILPAAFPKRRLTECDIPAASPLLPTAFQLGVSFIALVTGALVTRHASALSTASHRAGDGFVYRLHLPHMAPSQRAATYAGLLRDLRTPDRPASVSLTSPGALVGLGPVTSVTTDCGQCAENGMWLRWRVKRATHQFVSADTFRLLGVGLLAGRGLTDEDGWDTPRVAVVSRSLAAREFQDGGAIGRQLRVADDGANWSTVVGIVDDLVPVGIGGALQPRYAVYLSVLQHPPESTELLVRGTPATHRVNERPIREAALVAAEAAPLAWFGRWFAVEGWAMLAIAAIGTFARMWLWVQSLLGEFGLRRAVGARRRHLLVIVIVRAVAVALLGVAIGVWFGPAVWNVLPAVTTGLGGWSDAVVARYSCMLLATTVAGALIPAWRAARTLPSALMASRG